MLQTAWIMRRVQTEIQSFWAPREKQLAACLSTLPQGLVAHQRRMIRFYFWEGQFPTN